jgi:hypothetical protein
VKLYVWEKVLYDYTPGMAVALAPDQWTALSMFDSETRKDLAATEPDIIDLPGCRRSIKPRAWYVHGGG